MHDQRGAGTPRFPGPLTVSLDLNYTTGSMQTTRRQILGLLRDNGDAGVEELALHVGLAPVTVRHHVSILLEGGEIGYRSDPLGRGRPRHKYFLTEAGREAIAPDRVPSYDLLAGRLLDAMRDGDRGATQRFFADMARDLTAKRQSELVGQPIEVRLDAVTTALSEIGFDMRWERDGDDYLIRELACPYGSLSHDHAEVCAMDHAMIGRIVNGEVRREQWRVDGAMQCVYRVIPSGDSG